MRRVPFDRHPGSGVLLATVLLASSLAAPALAQVVVPVPGSSNPYLAGMPSGSTCCGGDAAPAQSPAQVIGIALSGGSTLTFAATGSVDHLGGVPSAPPDGSGQFSTVSTNGISGGTWPLDALVGVFLDNSLPTAGPAPAPLDFSGAGIGTSFSTLSPALKQVFFIGDGRTGTGTGAVQTFVAPAGATRLYLGTTDGTGWFNNTGSFNVTVTGTSLVSEVPALSGPALALLALALAASATFAIHRRI